MKTWTFDQVLEYGCALMVSSGTALIIGLGQLGTPFFWYIFPVHFIHFVLSMHLLLASQEKLRESRRELKENMTAQLLFQDDLKEALDAIENNLSDISYHDCPCGVRGVKLYVPSKLHWMVLCPDGHHSVDTTRAD